MTTPVERFVSAAGVPCDGCGATITDGVYCTAWANAAHYCDGCWERTAEYPDGTIGTVSARELEGPRPEWVRLFDVDGVPFFCEPHRR